MDETSHKRFLLKCNVGQMVSYITKKCMACPEKQYNTNGEGLHCENCIECGKGKYHSLLFQADSVTENVAI